MASKASESFGSAVGDTYETLDVLAVVAMCSLAFSFAYLVLLRFFIKPVVWCSLVFVFFLLGLAGVAAFTASFQCSGDSLTMTGQSYAQAVKQDAVTRVQTQLGADAEPTYNISDEAISGAG